MARKINDSPIINRIDKHLHSVGEVVEVYCDHNRDSRRVRDWLQGVVVQVDEKMVAIQFNEDVYLTDGWMVPDRVLWTQHSSESIRQAKRKRKRAKRKS